MMAAEESFEEARMLPHLTLWYAISLIYQWRRRLPEKQGLPSTERQGLEARLACTREKMPKEGDPYLVGGLVDYYCARDERQRLEAVDMLRKAIDLGVTLPEVIYLVQCEDRLSELSKNRFESYITLVRSYLAEASAPLDLRRELHEHLLRFERFARLGEISLEDNAGIAPSLHDIAASCQLIEDRVQRIFRGYTDDEKRTNVEKLLGGLRESRGVLDQTVGKLGETQQKLMRVAGEALLPEETRVEDR
jgi:hypothetical protein